MNDSDPMAHFLDLSPIGPMTDALSGLLERLRDDAQPNPSVNIVLIHDAKKRLGTAYAAG